MTGLEDVPDGQSVRGGVNSEQCKEYRCYSCFLADVKNMKRGVHKMKKKNLSLYELQSAVFIKLWQYSTNVFLASPRASKSS